MKAGAESTAFRVIATDCRSGGCPTVLESSDPADLVVIGKLDIDVLNSLDVQRHTGEGEIAVVIPKKIFMQAAKALS